MKVFLITVHKAGANPIDRFFIRSASGKRAIMTAKKIIKFQAEQYPEDSVGRSRIY